MDDQILNMLGLFTVPPEAKVIDKDEQRFEAQLLNAHKDFFNSNNDEAMEEEGKDDDGIYVD